MNWHNRGARPLGNSRTTTDRFSLAIALWIAAISSSAILNGAAAAGACEPQPQNEARRELFPTLIDEAHLNLCPSELPDGQAAELRQLADQAAAARAQAHFAEAAALFERVLQVRLDDPTTPWAERPKLLEQVALLEKDMGEFARAEKILREVLTMLETRQGVETDEVSNALLLLADVLEAQDKPVAAEKEAQRALDIRQRQLDSNDVRIAYALSKLGLAYQLEHRLEEAERVDRRVVAILRAHGPSLELASALNNLGNVVAARKRWKEGVGMIREAMAIWEQLLGPDHPSVAWGTMNLASLLQSRGRYDEAAALMQQALRIDRMSLPAGHPGIGLDLSRMAGLAAARKRYTQAEGLLLESREILEKSLPPGHPDTGRVLASLAEVYRSEKRWADAAEMYRRAIAILARSWGPEDQRLTASLEGYAQVLRVRQEFAEAANVDMQVSRIRTLHALRKM